MAKKSYKSNYELRVILVSLFAGILLFLNYLFIFNTIQKHNKFHESKHDELIYNIERLRYLNEGLTMSVNMCVATGNFNYEARYNKLSFELDRIIAETQKLFLDFQAREHLKRINTANVELVLIEKASFAMARKGNAKEALNILNSPEYSKFKNIYMFEVNFIFKILKNKDKEVGAQIRQSLLKLYITGVLVLIFLLFWWAISFKEIMERRRMQAVLRELKTHYHKLFESATDGILVVEFDTGKIIDVNPSFCELSGQARGNLVGKNIWDAGFFQEEDSVVKKIFNQAPDVECVCDSEAFISGKAGVKHNVELVCSVYFVEDKKVIRCLVRDITQKKKMEDLLREERNKAQNYLDTAGIMFMVLDVHQRITFINKMGCRILRVTQGQVMGKNWFDHFVTEEDRQEFKNLYIDMIAGRNNNLEHSEVPILNRNGEKRIILWQGVLLNDPKGSISGCLVSGEDITKQRQAEDALYRIREDLEIRVQRRTQELARMNIALQEEITRHKNTEDELRRSEEKYRSVVDNINIGVILISPKMEAIALNAQMRKWFTGVDLGENPFCYMVFNCLSRDSVCPECPGRNTLKDGQPHELITEILLAQKMVNFKITSSPIIDVDGKIIAVVEMFEDISGRKHMEDLLRESEAKYRTLIEEIPAVTYISQVATNPRMIYISPQIKAILGFNPEEWLEDADIWFKQVYPMDKGRVLSELAAAIFKKEKFSCIYRILHKDGQVKWVRDEAVLLEGANDAHYLHGVIFDITRLKRAEELVRESEGRYQEIVRGVTDYIYTVNFENEKVVKTEHGAACLAVTGYTKEEFNLNPELWIEIVPADERQTVLDWAKNIFKKNFEIKPIEHQIIRKDKTMRWIENTPILHYDAQGKIFSYDGVIKDITDKKIAREEHIRAEALVTIIEGVPDAIIVFDKNGRIKECNSAAFVNFGLTNTCINGWMGDVVIKADKTRFSREITCGLSRGFIKNLEVRIAARDGRLIPTLVNASGLGSSDKEFEGMIAVITDITERKQLEEMKDNFINIVSHELRTPLATIKEGVAQISDGLLGKITSRQDEFLKMIGADIGRLSRTINKLLNMSKMEGGKIRIEREIYDICALLKQSIENFIPKAKAKGIKIVEDMPGKGAEVYLDKDKIIEVFQNLLENAIKFTDRGMITVSIRDNKDFVEAQISDTGAGVKKEQLPFLFNKFYQAQRFTIVKERGIGLGLFITKNIVELHGGEIFAQSVFGEGTKITFRIPKIAGQFILKEYIVKPIEEALLEEDQVALLQFTAGEGTPEAEN